MWILYEKGACIASPKFPEDNEEIKVSMVENFLNRMYGGRVYYTNINFYEHKTTISAPIALYFSFSSKKKNRKIFRTKYGRYYVKNPNFNKIPSWNIICVNYNGFKLARFYEKNITSVLKNRITYYFKMNFKNYKSKKKMLKLIINHFKKKYRLFLVLNALLELIKEKKIEFNHHIDYKIQKKFLRQG
ncbi:MAG: hypothetical protein ACFFDN_42540 [Candidatus Hodarchaeota archaeon]